jgi:RND family efflux transporter MFP subunit
MKMLSRFFSLALALSVTACGRHPAPPASRVELPPAAVRVQTVESKTHTAAAEVIGTVRAKLRAQIEAKVPGRILDLKAVAGQAVKAGELLARLDVREIRARHEQAVAVREQADADLKRFATLVKQQAVTQQEFDAVQARQRVALAAETEAAAMLDHANITAPFAGIITRKLADIGDLATPGRPLLELEDPAQLRLEADIPESLINRLSLGSRLAVQLAAGSAPIEGTVSEIAPVADPNTRTSLVKLDLPAAPGLRAGLFGRVAIPVAESAALRVPAASVIVRGQLEFVFVATNQVARLRLIKTGKRIG